VGRVNYCVVDFKFLSHVIFFICYTYIIEFTSYYVCMYSKLNTLMNSVATSSFTSSWAILDRSLYCTLNMSFATWSFLKFR
jgi:hypothetical protein